MDDDEAIVKDNLSSVFVETETSNGLYEVDEVDYRIELINELERWLYCYLKIWQMHLHGHCFFKKLSSHAHI